MELIVNRNIESSIVAICGMKVKTSRRIEVEETARGRL